MLTKITGRCAIEADALNLGRKDIDNLAETLLNELDDEPYNQVNHGFDDHAALAERLRRVSNLYSQKLFNAESQLQLMKESFAEKGRTTSSRGSSSALKLNSLDSLRHKLEGFNAYWRREVRFYEGQLEKAGREHSTWSLVGIQNRLGTVHEKWAKQIEDILRGAEGALE